MNRFENQVVIVTGASRGLGQAIALRFAREGAQVACVSRSEASAGKVADEINAAHPGQARAYAVDVADFAAVTATVAQVYQDFGKVDVLVNNAGITKDGLAMRMSEGDWDAVLDTNLKGAFAFIQGVMRPMAKARAGRIINISSVAGLVGNAGQANYAASKAGLLGLTKALARELSGRSITVNAVAPGFIRTDMTDVLPEPIKKAVIGTIPLGHFGEAEDIAGAVAYLASAEGKYITGQCLTVDGGMVM